MAGSSGAREVILGPEMSPQGATAAGSSDTELPSGLGESEPALLFLTTAFGHTEGSVSAGIHLGWNAHLAVWSRFSNSVFLSAHGCDPWVLEASTENQI